MGTRKKKEITDEIDAKALEFITGCVLKDRNRIHQAVEKIQKMSRKVENWNSTDELRKLRAGP